MSTVTVHRAPRQPGETPPEDKSYSKAQPEVDIDSRDPGTLYVREAGTAGRTLAIFPPGRWENAEVTYEQVDPEDPEVLREALTAAVDQLARLATVSEALAEEARNRGLVNAAFVLEQVGKARSLLVGQAVSD